MKVRCNTFKECKNKKCMWYKTQETKMWMTFKCDTVKKWVSVDNTNGKELTKTYLKVLNKLCDRESK